MTETSPLAAVAHPPARVEIGSGDEMDWRARTGRVVGGVELRIVDDAGDPLPWDDEAVGEIEVRGPWITGAYYLDPSPEKFDDGWLRTGDVGSVNALGYIQITDRAKDVIKSGGEWISSIDLENLAVGHPSVAEAAVIGVPDSLRGLVVKAFIVSPRPGDEPFVRELQEWTRTRLAQHEYPRQVEFVTELPKTPAGKVNRKMLRTKERTDG
jgi:fatty-acyl-CoA synthase